MHILLPTQKWINLPLRIRSHLNKMKDKPYFKCHFISANPQNGQTHSIQAHSNVSFQWCDWVLKLEKIGDGRPKPVFFVFLLVSVHELHIIHVK